MSTLFTFLGTNNYLGVHYTTAASPAGNADELRSRIDAGKTTKTTRRFCQAASIDLGLCTPTKIIVATTSLAKENNYDALVGELRSTVGGSALDIALLDIEDGKNESELWVVFDEIRHALKDEKSIVFDTTHGFRSLPLVGLLSLAFIVNATDAEVNGILYAAFESLGPYKEVEMKIKEGAFVADAPIFDLTGMFVLPSWASAVDQWRTLGHAESLAKLAKKLSGPLQRELEQGMPKALKQLPMNLGKLSDALSLVRSDQIGHMARRVVDDLSGARAAMQGRSQFAPFQATLDGLLEAISPLTLSPDDDGAPTSAYLKHQAQTARFCLEHGRVSEGFSLLREAVLSLAVYVSQAAGVHGDSSSEEHRKNSEYSILHASGHPGSRSTPRSGNDQSLDRIRTWVGHNENAAQKFATAYDKVQASRNKVNHAWIGHGDKFTNGSRDSFQKDGVVAVEAFVEALSACAPEPGVEHVPPVAVSHDRLFLNLSNHPISTWSAEQIASAKALGFHRVEDLPNGMPLVDPTDSEDDILARAESLADQCEQLGAAGAFVASDFTFAFAVVNSLLKRGIVCYATTADRECEDVVNDDQTVEKRSTFRFVSWRKYV